MLPNKHSLLKIALLGLLLLCVLTILGYSFIHQKAIWATLGLYLVIFILTCLSIRFYLKSMENVSTNYQKLFNGNPLV